MYCQYDSYNFVGLCVTVSNATLWWMRYSAQFQPSACCTPAHCRQWFTCCTCNVLHETPRPANTLLLLRVSCHPLLHLCYRTWSVTQAWSPGTRSAWKVPVCIFKTWCYDFVLMGIILIQFCHYHCAVLWLSTLLWLLLFLNSIFPFIYMYCSFCF